MCTLGREAPPPPSEPGFFLSQFPFSLSPGCALLLRLHSLSPLADSVENTLPILIELQLGDDDFRRVHAEGHGLAVGFLSRHALDVDKIFQTVDGYDFALTAFVAASHYGDFVVFADGDGADIVFFSEFLAERGAHDSASYTGGSAEMEFARLAPRGSETMV